MITPEYMAQAFAGNLNILDRQLDGLDHRDSLLQPPFRGNCLNWVLGHILNARGRMMDRLLGLPPAVPFEETAIYETGSEAITADNEAVIDLNRLIDLLHTTQERINERLSSLDEGEYNAEDEDGRSLAQKLMGFYFHETYHVGQTELLRQLTGVNDKVI